MTVVGVTGKYCAGKNTVVEILEERFGYRQIDVDALGHAALEVEHDRIVARFGTTVIGADGRIDRKILGSMVFADSNALRALESITHPRMVEMTRQRVAEARRGAAGSAADASRDTPSPAGVVINAAILFRMKLDSLCDLVILVRAPLLQRLRRARRRDGSTLFQTLRRLASQRDVDPQYSSPDADIQSVVNDGSREALAEQIRGVLSLPHQ